MDFPLKNGRIYSPYGERTINGVSSFHRGVDIIPPHPQRVPYYAPRKCRVRKVVRNRGAGNTSPVNSLRDGVTGDGLLTDNPYSERPFTDLAGHVEVFNSIQPGDWLDVNQQVGWLNNSGNWTGWHVHYEVHPDTAPSAITRHTAADPAKYFTKEDLIMATLDAEDLDNIEKRFQKYVPKPKDMGTPITQQTSIERELQLLREARGKLNQIITTLDNLPTGPGGELTKEDVKSAVKDALGETAWVAQ